ncbi:MAG: deacylase [Rhodospirillales bacterium]|nr:deacylase [Rhodospirillales bacterium]
MASPKPQKSRISCDIDFEKNGKQVSYLRLPHSVHRSAYGWLAIPIIAIKNGDGPRVLLMAGNHGDEWEGQVTLIKLARELKASNIRGRVIILPGANAPAVRAGRRTSPLDFDGEGNLNRLFPGDANGSPTPMIAHFITSELLPLADVVFDLHSGGSSLDYIPSAEMKKTDDKKINQLQMDLLRAFGAPVGNIGEVFDDRTFSGTCKRLGVAFVSTELGGTGTVSPRALAVGEKGVRRCLKLLGTLSKNYKVEEAPPTRLVYVGGSDYYSYAPDEGLFEPYVDLGAEVKKGQPAGAVQFPETPWREAVVVRFQRAGLVLCKRIGGRVQRGDCVFHLASDYES